MKLVKRISIWFWYVFYYFCFVLTIPVLFDLVILREPKFEITQADLIYKLILAVILLIVIYLYQKNKDRKEREKAHHLDGEPEPL